MKTFLLIMAAAGVLGLQACQNKSDAATAGTEPASTAVAQAENDPPTEIKLAETEYNFGRIYDGEKVRHRIKFTNTGKNPLKIYDVKASCGCTTPDWTKAAVAPGAEGYVDFEFDSKGKVGEQNKSLTVRANTEKGFHQINFKGEVLARTGAAKQ